MYPRLKNIEKLIDKSLIKRSDYDVFEQAAARVHTFITGMDRTDKTWGLIHADLTDENYLIHQMAYVTLEIMPTCLSFFQSLNHQITKSPNFKFPA